MKQQFINHHQFHPLIWLSNFVKLHLRHDQPTQKQHVCKPHLSPGRATASIGSMLLILWMQLPLLHVAFSCFTCFCRIYTEGVVARNKLITPMTIILTGSFPLFIARAISATEKLIMPQRMPTTITMSDSFAILIRMAIAVKKTEPRPMNTLVSIFPSESFPASKPAQDQWVERWERNSAKKRSINYRATREV